MTSEQVLLVCRRAGIVVRAAGDYLDVDAPVGSLTPELREALVRHKPELIRLLQPLPEYVTLLGGLTLPKLALELAVDLECRGFQMRIISGKFEIEPAACLTSGDRAAIARWQFHLSALLSYEVPICA